MSDFPKFAQINEERPREGFRFAEDIVGHPLPGSVKMGGSLSALREKIQ